MALPQDQKPLEIDDYAAPCSLEEACRALSGGNATIVAGGTDLWVQKDEGARRFGARLVNISRIGELSEIDCTPDRIRLGALVTMSDVLASDPLRQAVPVLAATADRFASDQIRNAATIGGNIANASPAADFVIPLLCLDAEVVLARWTGDGIATRMVALAEFFTAPGATVRADDELIAGVEFAAPGTGFHAGFCKSGPRPALEIAIVSLGLAGRLDGGRMTGVRVALGAVAPTPLRCTGTERVIEGALLDDKTIAAALAALEHDIAPIGDVRGSAWYRTHLARTYLEQELRNAAQG